MYFLVYNHNIDKINGDYDNGNSKRNSFKVRKRR